MLSLTVLNFGLGALYQVITVYQRPRCRLYRLVESLRSGDVDMQLVTSSRVANPVYTSWLDLDCRLPPKNVYFSGVM